MNSVKKVSSILLAGLLAGCSSTAASSSAASSSSSADTEHVLNWFASGQVTTMDADKSYDVVSGSQIAYMTDTLYKLDADANTYPSLATGDPELSDDGLTATIKIREDAKFSNGDPITADSFVYGFRRVVDPATGSQSASNLSWIKNAAEITNGELDPSELGVSAVDDYTLEIQLVSPTPYLNYELSSSLTSPIDESFVEAQGDQYALSAEALVSSGPYVLEDWSGTDTSWKFTKNENYWDADNIYFDTINIQVITDNATGISLFEAGQLDGTSISGEYVTQYQGTDSYVQVPSLRETNLELGISSNTDLQNLNLRKALSYSINREELVENILNGAGTPSVGIIPDGIATNPDTGESVAEDFGNLVVYDVDQAKQYWADALEELGKSEVTLVLLTSDDDQSVKVGTYLQSQLESNLDGLTIDVQNVTSQVRFQEMMSYDFDLALGGWSGEYDPTSYVKQFETNYEHNHGKWVSDELTELVNDLEQTDGNDFSLRWSHLKEANQYLIDNQVTIPLYQGANSFLVNSKLKGYVTHSLGGNAVDINYAYFEN